jgi:cytochrome c oxidase assembly factor CtaG
MSLGHWQAQPAQLLPLLALGLAYWLRARELAAKGRPLTRTRRSAFYAGLAFALIALVSPLDWYGENRLLWAHMIQHLLLGDIAPLLVVLGLTGAILRPILAVRPIHSLRGLGHPLVALPLWAADLYLWHVPALYQAALRHEGFHALEHFCFFLFGALMWAAVIEPLPGPAWFGNGWKALYTLVVRTAGMILAFVLIWVNHPLYDYYVSVQRGTGTSTLSDQRAAGAIMFIEGSIVTLFAFAWLFIRFTRELEIRQRLLEQDLDEAAAARAARYGRSARVKDLAR